jgi:hypothetical protein
MIISTPISTQDSRLTCEHCHGIGYASTGLSPIAEGLGARRRHGQQAFTRHLTPITSACAWAAASLAW